MKIYTVIDSDIEDIYGLYSFKTCNDAQEFILACAQEDALNTFNSLCLCAPVPTGKYVIENWKSYALLCHKSLEAQSLHDGALGWSKIYENEFLED